MASAAATLPEYARPRRLRIVEQLPLTDGFRPIKIGLRDLAQAQGPNLYVWNPHEQRFEPAAERRAG